MDGNQVREIYPILEGLDLFQGVGFHIDLTLRTIQEAYLKRFKQAGFDISIEQWVILHKVHLLGDGASQQEIVKSNFRNRATTSRVIGKLEKKGWLIKERFPGDQKRFRLVLTKDGEEVVSVLLPIARELREQAIKNLDRTDFEVFLKVLNTLKSNYETNEGD